MSNTVETIFVAKDEQSKTVKKLTGDLNRYDDTTKKADKNTGKLTGSMTTLGVQATAAAGAVAGLLKFTSKMAEEADNAFKASQRMGVSLSTYQRLDSAAKHAGTSISTMSTAMRRLLLNMTQAEQGSKKSVEAFEKLGVSAFTASGEMRNQEEVFKESLIALSEMTNETERNALAQEVLGRNASELAPLLNEGADAVRNYLTANDSAVMVSERMAMASAKYNDELQTLGETLKKEVMTQITPFVEELGNMMEEMRKSGEIEIWSKRISKAVDIAVVSFYGLQSAMKIGIFAIKQNLLQTQLFIQTVAQEAVRSVSITTNAMNRITGGRVKFLRVAKKRSEEALDSMSEKTRDTATEMKENAENLLIDLNDISDKITRQLSDVSVSTTITRKTKTVGGGEGGGAVAEASKSLQDQIIADQIAMEELITEITFDEWLKREEWKQQQIEKDAEFRKQKEQEVFDNAFALGGQMTVLFNTIFSKRAQALDSEAAKRKKLAKENIKDQKKLDKELSKIDAETEERKKKIAMADYIARVAGATGDLAGAVLGVVRDQPGGAISKVAAGLAIAGFGASFLSTVIGSKPQFYNGSNGPINDGSGRTSDGIPALVRNNESVLNPSETALWGVLRDNYTRGVNNTTNNNGNSYNINVSVQGGGSNQELTAMLTTALPEVLERGVKTGDIDLGRMGIVTV